MRLWRLSVRGIAAGWRKVAWHLGAVAVVLTCLAAPLGAQQGQPDDGFVTMTPEQMAAAQESLPAAPLVFIAYAVAWVVMLGYVLVLWRKQARLEEELRHVRAELRSDQP